MLSVFCSMSHAEDDIQAEMQKQSDSQSREKTREEKPFDLGLGGSLAWSSGRFIWGWDVIVGKRLYNTENWGYGLQYHYLNPTMNAVYVTATPFGKPGQFKLGLASINYLDTANELGLAVGIGVLDESRFNGKVHFHLFDIEHIFMADRSYTLFTISVTLLTHLH